MSLPAQIEAPAHVAIIMDGNGRWAEQRGYPRALGHRRGAAALRATVRVCVERGVRVLTVFAFSSENWRRPSSEVGALMKLFVQSLRREVHRLHEAGVRLRFIGERGRFEPDVQVRMAEAEALTAGNERMTLVVAVNYGGRWDIAQAARALAEDVAAGRLTPADVDEAAFAARLTLSDLPEPDLLIRTGGEQRISNFLLWQLAYAELYFTPVLWPDFDAAEMDRAIAWYAKRERRFGQTSAQIQESVRA